MNKPSFYAVLPASVRYDEKLGSSEKLFYAEITAMSEKEGYCWASNSYFSELYGVSKNTITRWVTNLKERGHIVVNIIRDGKEIKRREIYPIQKIDDTYPQKSKGGTNKNLGRGTHKNGEENTTRFNTTRVNNTVTTVVDDGSSETIQSAQRVANNLLESICSYDPTHRYNVNKPSLNSWVKDIDKAIRLDGRTEEQLDYIIEYVFHYNGENSSFWAGNIESGLKLRKQFDKIKNQIKSERNGRKKPQSQKVAEAEQFLNSL